MKSVDLTEFLNKYLILDLSLRYKLGIQVILECLKPSGLACQLPSLLAPAFLLEFALLSLLDTLTHCFFAITFPLYSLLMQEHLRVDIGTHEDI